MRVSVNLPVRMATIGAVAVVFGISAVMLISHRAGAAQTSASVPPLMLRYDQGWAGGFTFPVPPAESWLPADYLNNPANIQAAIARGAPRDKVIAYLEARSLNEYIPPPSGIGPVSDGPDYPFYNNPMRAVVAKNGTFRIADLTSESAKNLMPWAIEALKKQNALVLAGKNGETRQRDAGRSACRTSMKRHSRCISSRRPPKSSCTRVTGCGTSI